MIILIKGHANDAGLWNLCSQQNGLPAHGSEKKRLTRSTCSLLCNAASAVVHILKDDAIINKQSAVQTLFRHSLICLFPFSLLLTDSLSQVFVNSFGATRIVVIIPSVIQPGTV